MFTFFYFTEKEIKKRKKKRSPYLTCQATLSFSTIQISNRIYFLIFHSWLQVGYKPTTPFSYHQYLTFHPHFTIPQNNIA